MIELMLHHTSQIAFHPFVVGLHLLVKPLHMNTLRTFHLLVDGRQREASLLHRVSSRLVILHNMRIDENMTEILVFRHVIAQHVQVDDNHTDSFTNLRSCQSDAFTLSQRLPHVINQRVQLREIGGNILSNLAKHRLAIYINR